MDFCERKQHGVFAGTPVGRVNVGRFLFVQRRLTRRMLPGFDLRDGLFERESSLRRTGLYTSVGLRNQIGIDALKKVALSIDDKSADT